MATSRAAASAISPPVTPIDSTDATRYIPAPASRGRRLGQVGLTVSRTWFPAVIWNVLIDPAV
ncbi:MAG TPA: hypothetical protein VNO25_21590, partial [Streptosporangiaceae bacterium]|nr:hypothetical protein [Streptosporangiaceae bacterium]